MELGRLGGSGSGHDYMRHKGRGPSKHTLGWC